MMTVNIIWSPWLPLNRDTVNESVPQEPGAYQIRPIGASSAAYIGSATGRRGLRQRLGQRASNPSRYLSGFEKKLDQIGLKLEFCYARANTPTLALTWESSLLNDYKSRHNEKLPPGNRKLPKRYN